MMLPLTMKRHWPGIISITLPSRLRRKMLTDSVTSLRGNAAKPELLEFLVAADPDDPGTVQTARDLGFNVIWTAPQRYGYGGSARYYAKLLQACHGEWILPTWGDDGLMQTERWDDIVRDQPPATVIFVTGNYPGRHLGTSFPIVHRAILQATRRIPDLPALDNWFWHVAQMSGRLIYPNPEINVLQDRYDATGNNNDLTYREGRSGYRDAEYFSPPYERLREQDAAAIRAW
jgi:hypothetical protein